MHWVSNSSNGILPSNTAWSDYEFNKKDWVEVEFYTDLNNQRKLMTTAHFYIIWTLNPGHFSILLASQMQSKKNVVYMKAANSGYSMLIQWIFFLIITQHIPKTYRITILAGTLTFAHSLIPQMPQRNSIQIQK